MTTKAKLEARNVELHRQIDVLVKRNDALLEVSNAAAELLKELCRATDIVSILWAHIPDAARKRVEQDVANRGLNDWDTKARAAIAKAEGAK